jgi:cytochrome c oxidase subunit III
MTTVGNAPPSMGSAGSDRRPSVLSVGVVVWLASEVLFFAGLFAAYFVLRAETSQKWLPADVHLDTARAVVFSVVLLASSVSMHFAVHAATANQRRKSFALLAVTFVLGAAFLANLGLEWRANTFSIDSHAYGSIYYILTGFHGLHLLGGLALMGSTAWLVSGPGRARSPGPMLTVTSYYWHFVDVVWVAVFFTIFVVR